MADNRQYFRRANDDQPKNERAQRRRRRCGLTQLVQAASDEHADRGLADQMPAKIARNSTGISGHPITLMKSRIATGITATSASTPTTAEIPGMLLDAIERRAHANRKEQEGDEDDHAIRQAHHQFLIFHRDSPRSREERHPRRQTAVAAVLIDVSGDNGTRTRVDDAGILGNVPMYSAFDDRIAAEDRDVSVDDLIAVDDDVTEVRAAVRDCLRVRGGGRKSPGPRPLRARE